MNFPSLVLIILQKLISCKTVSGADGRELLLSLIFHGLIRNLIGISRNFDLCEINALKITINNILKKNFIRILFIF